MVRSKRTGEDDPGAPFFNDTPKYVVSATLAAATRIAAGEAAVSMFTRIRGASNAKARRALGWAPRYPSWREGFRLALADAPAARTSWTRT